jgi:heme-degrading monooxygenase HmoA
MILTTSRSAPTGALSSYGSHPLIVREWRATASPEGARDYEEYVRDRLLPELMQLEGFMGLWLLARDVGEHVSLVVVTRWRSLEAIRGFAREDVERAVVHPDAQAMLREMDERVIHYEARVTT